ncbi:MAG: hypothetical protein Q8M98_07680 [Candidatus Cloacimonadaceae bacterium]|nr:hypothetical protein [Candidatus Cloacimonadaceae bacterium]MDP3114643.1 hypothetical protein [Candidatus Cloacimonadaceae bacterium]
MLRFAIYASHHGYGHASRMAALAEELTKFGIFVQIRSAKPDFLFNRLDPLFSAKSAAVIDAGVRHGDQLAVDLPATKCALLDLMDRRLDIIDSEVEYLRREKIDLVIADIPFLAVEAATYAGIPVFAVSNFDWFYIYKELFANDIGMRPLINTIFGLYQRVDHAFCLPFSSKDSMSAFSKVESIGLLARKKDIYRDVKQELGIKEPVMIVMFGGEEGMSVNIDAICKAFEGKVVSMHASCGAENHISITPDADFLDFIHASDIVLTKPGYSSFAEAVQFNKFILYCPRKNYPEERVLIDELKRYPYKLQLDSLDHKVNEWKRVFEQITVSQAKKTLFSNRNREIASTLIQRYIELRLPGSELISVIDAGSNNINYALVDISRKRVIHSMQLTTGLGRDYNLTADKQIRLSVKSMESFKQSFRDLMSFDVRIPSRKQVIATGIARKAMNINKLSEWIETRYQIKYKIISGQDECRYAYHAAQHMTELSDDAMIVDIGGFSTEFVLKQSGKTICHSLPLGLLSIKKAYDTDTYSAENITEELAAIPDTGELVLVGLTAFLLAKVVRRLIGFNVFALHGQHIRKSELIKLREYIAQGKASEIIPYLIDPASTDILRLSTDFVIQILDRFGLSDFIVCYYGISVGYALWKIKKAK